jgi:hypothetical protein
MALDIILAVLGLLVIAIVLWDAFETVVLPRRVTRQFRLARVFYRFTWMPWSAIGRRARGNFRETLLGVYGPLSLIFLLAVWAILMIVGFAILHRAVGSLTGPEGTSTDFGTDLYMSGSSFFTLGLGDITPDSTASRILAVIEAGAGFGFLALVISYLPVLYQAFSRREANVTLLDSRAGSPPSAGEFLLRLSSRTSRDTLPQLLEDWERWSADLLESHLSYPVLAFYRSQHEQESWLAAMTTILDISALVMCGFAGDAKDTAKLTFAMTRHAAVDIAQIFHTDPRQPYEERLPPEDFARLRVGLGHGEHPPDAVTEAKLKELRLLYEPYVAAISRYLLMPLPGWMPANRPDNWQSSAWNLPE